MVGPTSPVTCVLKRGNLEQRPNEANSSEGHVMTTKAETGGTQLQAKEHQGLLAVTRC